MKKFIVAVGTISLLAGHSLLAQDTNVVSAVTNSTTTSTTTQMMDTNSVDTNGVASVMTTTTSTYTTNSVRYDQPPKEYYRANEFSIDLFVSDSLDQHTVTHPSGDRIHDNSRTSAGAGATWFFLRYVGIGGEAYTENTRHNFIDAADGFLIARLPICDTGLAPYILGGAGRRFDPFYATYWDAGAGLEFRFTPHVGIFTDARYVGSDRINNYYFGRAGVRVIF